MSEASEGNGRRDVGDGGRVTAEERAAEVVRTGIPVTRRLFPEFVERIADAIRRAEDEARREALEEAAKVCDATDAKYAAWEGMDGTTQMVARCTSIEIAKALRALAAKETP